MAVHDICCSCTILDASYLNVFHISVGSGNGNPELVALPLYIRCGYRYGIIYIAGKKKNTQERIQTMFRENNNDNCLSHGPFL